ncbi:MAG: hypothetical protein AAB358_03710 [Patescibacteria group bacterium]
MPKINLYRNISLTFVVFTAMLIAAVFLFFYRQATIIITPNEQPVNLSFNVEVKKNPTADELAEKEVVTGSLVSEPMEATSTFPVLSTQTVESVNVGRVKITNQSSRSQPLVKTTQLQAGSGVVVRTVESVTVPAGGSAVVEVYPKDPADFSDIAKDSKLTIIKLNPALQDQIFGTASDALTKEPHEVKVLSESDINRAKDEISKKILAEAKAELKPESDNELTVRILNFKINKKIGDRTDDFIMTVSARADLLQIDNSQLTDLIKRKIASLNLGGLKFENINPNNLTYTILDPDLAGSALVKVEYAISTIIDENNEIFNRENLAGKTVAEVKNYFSQFELVKEAEVLVSPYWQKTLPKQASKIKIIIQP